ncbi:hypothetical protein Kpol_1026p26 [Vanderwaltozyma polyspora DSM 70294]|uniref:tRNA wybutosine-synthesizing protein 3 n=1 Tax=Vanderwaltozyma polyspora (strain ATCC 22028 / DSM 70294 / BCRC 21397 / CBS 2163 / NBRC 10782 / NRRL Y-8283 / UCD 57-17) TaxID=436907 RepID=A7TNJ5_VANPO|nr:uncharacterized protein Kpol_1026p26 [Vanderwaltozyma polyspora DSM 70294]EDO16178.1 hypothetical protein Kpol_1026p26 [Vanderwaltozyma polyspora DSM 70294]
MSQHNNAFNQKKKAILDEINSLQPDLSPKGTIDELCLPIMHLINSHDDMVTTSSCSGRISVFAEGSKMHNGLQKVGGKGEGGKWLFVSHDNNNVIGWLETISKEGINFVETNIDDSTNHLDGGNRFILYKYEPFILHVKCRDFEMASKLYNVAMACGFRESGIGSNNLVAIRINIKLDVPIGYIDENTNDLKLFVPKDYILLLDRLTLSKFEENSRKMQELYDRIRVEIIEVPKSESSKVETKEERRERKMREGLAKQRIAQEQKMRNLSIEKEIID